jgi:hypothetical protein
MHSEKPGGIGTGLFALPDHLDDFSLLMGLEFRPASPIRPFLRAAFRPAFARSFILQRLGG